jgi:RimJ/RimL family protein N-acetyltransferase
MPVELETERLRLRQWREEDVDPFHAFYLDPQTTAIYGSDIKRHDVWRRVATIIGRWQLRGFGLWALEDKASGKFAGYSGLWFPSEFGNVEVGWGLAPAYRGKGLATEGARCARGYGYGALNVDSLVSYVLPTNAPSRRVAERLGAVPDGTFLLQGKEHTIFRHPRP